MLQRYIEISQSHDIATLEARLVKMAEELGFPLVSAAVVVEPAGAGRGQFFTLSNTPAEFKQVAADPRRGQRDPVNQRLRQLSVPFIYDQSLYVEAGAGDLWEQQAPFGYRNGVAVALHLPNGQHFLLGVDRDTALPSDGGELVRMMADLQLLAVHVQGPALNLLVPKDPALPELTPKEGEILKWTMVGKSAWDVGQILGMSEHTVNFHLRKVFKKLNCSNKHQAVHKAVQLGLL